MIFPGMDPYLEDPQLWTGVHASLIVYFRNQLQPQLRPRYVAAIEERVYLEGAPRVPDVWVRKVVRPKKNGPVMVLEADEPLAVQVAFEEVRERYVAILDPHSANKVVTVIELVSPTNMKPGPGRDSYLAKQREVLQSDANFVEICMLRSGDHVLAAPEWVARSRAGDYDYLACVNRQGPRRKEFFDLYPRKLPERLPRIRIPLAGKDEDVILDVQRALEDTYADGSYDLRIRYDRPCVPPLSKKDQAWARQLIRKAKESRSRKS